MNSLWVIR